MNGAHLASPMRGELGYAQRPHVGFQIHCPIGNRPIARELSTGRWPRKATFFEKLLNFDHFTVNNHQTSANHGKILVIDNWPFKARGGNCLLLPVSSYVYDWCFSRICF